MQLSLAPTAVSAPLARQLAARCSRTHLLQPLRCQQRATRRMVAVRAEEAESSSKAATAAADEPVAAEALLRRKKGSKAASKAAGGGGMGGDTKKAGPTVIAPLRDQIYNDEPLTEEQKAEGAVVSTLAILFVVILAEGIFLAGSGFMSEGADQFAQDIVFPAFSPTLGLFLLISSAYGVWKTRGNEESQKKN